MRAGRTSPVCAMSHSREKKVCFARHLCLKQLSLPPLHLATGARNRQLRQVQNSCRLWTRAEEGAGASTCMCRQVAGPCKRRNKFCLCVCLGSIQCAREQTSGEGKITHLHDRSRFEQFVAAQRRWRAGTRPDVHTTSLISQSHTRQLFDRRAEGSLRSIG